MDVTNTHPVTADDDGGETTAHALFTSPEPEATTEFAREIGVENTPVALQLMIGAMIVAGNLFVLLVLWQGTSLSRATRFLLGNLALGDILFGGGVLARGMLFMFPARSLAVCRHVLGTVTAGLVASFGSTAVMSVHTLYVVRHGASYRARAPRGAVLVAQAGVWAAAGGFGAAIWTVARAPEIPDCSPNTGYAHPYYFGVLCAGLLVLMAASIGCQAASGALLRRLMTRVGALATSSLPPGGSATEQTGRDEELKLETIEPSPSKLSDRRNEPHHDDNGISSLHGAEATNRGTDVATSRSNVELFVAAARKEPQAAGSLPIPTNGPLPGNACASSPTPPGAAAAAANRRNVRRQKQTIALIALLSGTMFVCWTPSIVIILLYAFHPSGLSGHHSLPARFMTLSMLNSLMNVVIYFIKDRSFRKRSWLVVTNTWGRCYRINASSNS